MVERFAVETLSFNKMGLHVTEQTVPRLGLREKEYQVSPWPSQSPDLNPIEHLWDEIKKRLDAKPCKNLEELKTAIFELWENIDEDVTKNLVFSMPRHCASVIAAHGGSTKYWTARPLCTGLLSGSTNVEQFSTTVKQ